MADAGVLDRQMDDVGRTFGDRLRLLIRLVNVLQARRTSEAEALLVGFTGIATVLACYGAYCGARHYVAHGFAVEGLVLGAVAVWVLAGVPLQVRLARDHACMSFLRTMPVGPVEIAGLHARASLLPAAGIAIVFTGMLFGAGVELWSLRGAARLPTLATGLIWVVSLDTCVVMALARAGKGRAVLLGLLLAWWLFLQVRIGIHLTSDDDWVSPILHVAATDWGLRILGVNALVQALTAPSEEVLWTTAAAMVHLAAAASVTGYIAVRLAGRPPRRAAGAALSIRLSRPVAGVMRRVSRGALGATLAIEWLRVLRSAGKASTLYTLIVFGLVLADSLRPDGGTFVLPLLGLGAAAIAVDTCTSVLDARRGNLLYEVCAVNARDYWLGFTTAFGIVLGSLCAVQVLALGVWDPDMLGRLFIACTTTCVVLADVGVTVTRHGRSMSPLKRLLLSVPFGLVAICITLLILSLSFSAVAIPIVGLCAFLFFESRHAQRAVIRRLYWNLS